MTDATGARPGWPATGLGSPRAMTTPRAEAAPKRILAATGFLLSTIPRRRSGRYMLQAVVVALALAGVYLLIYPTLTNVLGHEKQTQLQKQFASSTLKPGVHPKEGSPLTKLLIPKLKINIIVVEGTSGNALRAGAGHYPSSALPGDPVGNVAIAGHRTGFGEPFRHLDWLRPGDEIDLVTPFGKFIYQVKPPFDGHTNPWITSPTDWSVISPTPDAELTLTTCDPPHTSQNRLIVRAVLLRSIPT